MYKYDFQGMVNIHCNTDILEKDFSFFHTDSSHPPHIELCIGQIQPPEDIRLSIGKSYFITEDGVFFSYPWIRPVNLWLRGVESDTTSIVGTRMYHSLSHLVKGGYELMSVFRAVFALKLLHKSFCILPAAALDFNGKGVLIAGISNTGKTSTSLSLMSLDKESKYITDQFVVCGSNAKCYGLPTSMLVSRSAVNDFRIRLDFSKTIESYVKSIASKLLTTKLVNNKIWIHPRELFPRERITLETNAASLLIVRKSKFGDSVRELSREEAYNILRTIMLHEITWINNPILTAYAAAHQLNLTNDFELENSIVRAFVNRLDGVFLVNLSSPRSIKNMQVVKEIL